MIATMGLHAGIMMSDWIEDINTRIYDAITSASDCQACTASRAFLWYFCPSSDSSLEKSGIHGKGFSAGRQPPLPQSLRSKAVYTHHLYPLRFSNRSRCCYQTHSPLGFHRSHRREESYKPLQDDMDHKRIEMVLGFSLCSLAWTLIGLF